MAAGVVVITTGAYMPFVVVPLFTIDEGRSAKVNALAPHFVPVQQRTVLVLVLAKGVVPSVMVTSLVRPWRDKPPLEAKLVHFPRPVLKVRT